MELLFQKKSNANLKISDSRNEDPSRCRYKTGSKQAQNRLKTGSKQAQKKPNTESGKNQFLSWASLRTGHAGLLNTAFPFGEIRKETK